MRPIYVEELKRITGMPVRFIAHHTHDNTASGNMLWTYWPGFGFTPQEAVNIFIRKTIEKEGGPVI